MFSKEEIQELFNKGFQTQAYKAIVAEHKETFEKLDFRVAFEKLKEELELPIERNRLYMIYWRKKGKEGKEAKKKVPAEGSRPAITAVQEKHEEPEKANDSLEARLEKMEHREYQENRKKWNF